VATTAASPALLPPLHVLRDVLRTAPLRLEVPGVAEARTVREETVAQLDDYVIPRVRQVDAPLLAVVGGSTGAGKSTLVNTLVGRPVSASGVLRPTTRSAVLVHHPDDASWFGPDRLLPDLARTDAPSTDVGELQLVPAPTLPQGLALLDAPDVDSVERANRVLATQLLAAADLWLFTTSAARYADQVPWEFLKAAAERSTAVAVVLDRTAPGSVEEIRSHLGEMLEQHGLGSSLLFAVPEAAVDPHGLLPPEAVAPVREWLNSVAADAAARTAIIEQTLRGAVRQVVVRAEQVADAVEEQERTTDALADDAARTYERSIDDVEKVTADGSMLRGEVLARWQDFVGAGGLTRSLEQRVGWVRDHIRAGLTGRPAPSTPVEHAVQHGLHTLLVEQGEDAAERTAAAWSSTEPGRVLLGESPELGRASRALSERAELLVRDWQGGILEMVREEGQDKRTTARFLAYGINGLGVALMVLVFSQTAGLSGGEVGVAGGTALLAQRVLEAVFGDQAVRTLAARAHRDLLQRTEELLYAERDRFFDVLDTVGAGEGTGAALRRAARGLEQVRTAGPA
jgi:hypothetical protein